MDTLHEARDLTRPVAVVETLNLFRDPWDFGLLVECFFGVRRFEEFQSRLGISRNMLSKRLKALVAQDVLERRLYMSKPDRFEYRLTDKGRDLFPIFMAVKRWGEKWIPDAASEEWFMRHDPCGHECNPITACDRCGGEIAVRDITVVPTTKD
jgi:DNA-binding HxlR family transcriptional regulator